MSPRLRLSLVLTRTAGLLGFVVGLVHAVTVTWNTRWVREFQAGDASPLAERAISIATRAALDGLGFAAAGLLLGLLAWLLTALLRSSRPDGERLVGWFAIAVAAFFAWSTFGAWLANEALPFLEPGPLFLVDVAGFAAFFAGFALVLGLARLLPGAPADPVPAALGAIAATFAGSWAGLTWLRTADAGWRAPSSLAIAALFGLASVPVARLVGRLLERPAAAVGRRAAARGLVPRRAELVLGILFLACLGIAAPGFRLSASPAEVSYSNLEPTAERPAGPNVVLVTVDTLRADHLGAYGYERPTSPFLDSLAARGTVFADASAAAAWTKPATGTILTGLYPSRHGALYHGSSLHLPEGNRTLAEVFRDAGWVTAGFVTNPNLKKVFEFDRGFQEYFDSPVEDTVALASIRGSFFGRILMSLTRHQFNWKYENDVLQMNEHIDAWLEKNADDPFFLYLHYIDPHIPYAPPPAYREQFARDHGLALFNDRKERVGMDLYDAEIRYTDDGLAELVGRLQELGLWENTLFVLTSDHGEEFFEHGVLGHGFSLYQGVIHVPLIAHGPGVAAGRRVETPVQIVDLAASLTDLVGAGDTLGDGHSFAAAMQEGAWTQDRSLYLENEFGQTDDHNRDFVLSGVREGPWKLVFTEQNLYFPPQRYGRYGLYNVEEDPGETRNLFDSEEHRDVVERLVKQLREHALFLVETGFRDIQPAALSPEVAADLQALGYL